jgi:hypothetical protein
MRGQELGSWGKTTPPNPPHHSPCYLQLRWMEPKASRQGHLPHVMRLGIDTRHFDMAMSFPVWYLHMNELLESWSVYLGGLDKA